MLRKSLVLLTVVTMCAVAFASKNWQEDYKKRYENHKKNYERSKASVEEQISKQKHKKLKKIYERRLKVVKDTLAENEKFLKAVEAKDRAKADLIWQIVSLKSQKNNLVGYFCSSFWWKRHHNNLGKRNKKNPEKYDDVIASIQVNDDNYKKAIISVDQLIKEIEKLLE